MSKQYETLNSYLRKISKGHEAEVDQVLDSLLPKKGSERLGGLTAAMAVQVGKITNTDPMILMTKLAEAQLAGAGHDVRAKTKTKTSITNTIKDAVKATLPTTNAEHPARSPARPEMRSGPTMQSGNKTRKYF